MNWLKHVRMPHKRPERPTRPWETTHRLRVIGTLWLMTVSIIAIVLGAMWIFR